MMAMPLWLKTKLHLPLEIRKAIGGRYTGHIAYTVHHESHAASCFFPSPYDEAAIAGLATGKVLGGLLPALPRLVLGVGTVYAIYFVVLMFGFGQKQAYLDLLKQLTRPAAGSAKSE